ncbi:hypothetical protein ACIP93_37540 [Streptomyces sp. NPDC088745]|uniref:hypothetical protein n=1 Tax=Streptomyces sp. NPDC088745 TaxID=3365884 RepID=UPI003826C8DA
MSAAQEARAVLAGTGAAMTALRRGSAVLVGRICRCAGRVLGSAWDLVSIDPGAQAAAEKRAVKAAKARAKKAGGKRAAKTDAVDDGQEDDDREQVPVAVPTVRRPLLESLGYAVIGGLMVAGAAGTIGALVGPHLVLLTPWRPLILSAALLGWVTAAWMVAPPALVEEDHGQEDDGQEAAEEVASPETAADALMRHVLCALADAEAAGTAGVHLRALVESAAEEELLPPGMDKIGLRDWIASCGLPPTKSLKLRGHVDFGVRVDRVTEALGMSPADAVTKLFETPTFDPAGEGLLPSPEGAGEGSPDGPSEAPAESAPEGPAGAPAGALPGVRLAARLRRAQPLLH